jgi:integrase
VLAHAEVESFFEWLSKRWRGWRLPILFLETKRLVGCRIYELAAAESANLRDGRLHFACEVAKGRKERGVRLPPALYEELRAISGRKFVFELFPKQLRKALKARGLDRWAEMVGQSFEPIRLKKWLERENRQYLKKNPTAKKFKLHNLRGTAMSKAKEAGVHFEDAAIAFGCNADTMRKHYLALDEVAVTDRVMDAIQGNGNGNGHAGAPRSDGAKSGDPRFSDGEKNGASRSDEERRERGEI